MMRGIRKILEMDNFFEVKICRLGRKFIRKCSVEEADKHIMVKIKAVKIFGYHSK